MKKFFDKLQSLVEKLTPALNKFTQNPWVAGLQAAVIKIIPLTLVSTLVTIYDIVRNYVTSLPSMSALSTFSFGISGICVAILVPYYIIERTRPESKITASITSIGIFLMCMMPEVTDAGYVFNFDYFGAIGIFAAIVIGMVVALVFTLTKNIKFASEESALPDFCKEWFNTLLPMASLFIIAWVLTDVCHVAVFDLLIALFEPLITKFGDSLIGIIIMEFLQCALYTMGISPWTLYGIIGPIMISGLAANTAAAAAGLALPFIYVDMVTNAYSYFGGTGCTLPLNIYMLTSKNKRLKTLGEAFIVPSMMNINEPIMYSTVVWNPILMLPCWITIILNSIIFYVAISTGLVLAPHSNFALWYIPMPIQGWVHSGFAGLLLTLVIIAVDMLVWLPFFKIYEKQCNKEDAEEAVAEQ